MLCMYGIRGGSTKTKRFTEIWTYKISQKKSFHENFKINMSDAKTVYNTHLASSGGKRHSSRNDDEHKKKGKKR